MDFSMFILATSRSNLKEKINFRTLEVVEAICSSNVSFSSIVMPKYLVELTLSIFGQSQGRMGVRKLFFGKNVSLEISFEVGLI